MGREERQKEYDKWAPQRVVGMEYEIQRMTGARNLVL
jgi:hypothetical protein